MDYPIDHAVINNVSASRPAAGRERVQVQIADTAPFMLAERDAKDLMLALSLVLSAPEKDDGG
jgi:hypothetical protein